MMRYLTAVPAREKEESLIGTLVGTPANILADTRSGTLYD